MSALRPFNVVTFVFKRYLIVETSFFIHCAYDDDFRPGSVRHLIKVVVTTFEEIFRSYFENGVSLKTVL